MRDRHEYVHGLPVKKDVDTTQPESSYAIPSHPMPSRFWQCKIGRVCPAEEGEEEVGGQGREMSHGDDRMCDVIGIRTPFSPAEPTGPGITHTVRVGIHTFREAS